MTHIFNILLCVSMMYFFIFFAISFAEVIKHVKLRGGSRAAAISKMEHFVIMVNGFQPLTIITKRSILDVAAVLDPPLKLIVFENYNECKKKTSVFDKKK